MTIQTDRAGPDSAGLDRPTDEQMRLAAAVTSGDHETAQQIYGRAWYVDVCRAEHRLKQFVKAGQALLDSLPGHWHDDATTELRDLVEGTDIVLRPGFFSEAKRNVAFAEYGACSVIPSQPPATGEAPASTSDAGGDLVGLSAATKAECVLLAGSIRQDLGKLADAHGDLANDLDDTCDRIVDRVLAFLAARKLPTAVGVTPAVADITQRRCAGIRKAWEAGSWPDEGGISFLLRHAEARVADLVSRSAPPQAAPAQGGVPAEWSGFSGCGVRQVRGSREDIDTVKRWCEQAATIPVLQERIRSLDAALRNAASQPATEAAPSPAGMVEKAALREIADRLVVDACELPDRTSPEDQPDMLLITGEELHGFLMAGMAEALAHPQGTPAADQGWRGIETAPGDGTPVLVGWSGTGFEATKAHCENGIWGTLDPDMTFWPMIQQPDVFRELPISPDALPTPPASTEA